MSKIVLGAFLLAGWAYMIAEMGEGGRREKRDNALSAIRAIAAGAAAAMLVEFFVPDVRTSTMFWTGITVGYAVGVWSQFSLYNARSQRGSSVFRRLVRRRWQR